jgi:predicted phosphohydrolase
MPHPLPMSSIPNIFALADPHLSFGRTDRDMSRFGDQWINHPDKIRRNAAQTVGPDDILLLPGDLSWAGKRLVAIPDLAFLASLPGRKICIKGNHDHWWGSGQSIDFDGLETPPIIVGDLGIAGTRGWQTPRGDTADFDRKMILRESDRLEKSLAAISGCPVKIAMLHYPPHPFATILERHRVDVVVYGHLHVESLPEDEALVLNGERMGGALCWCVAADRIDFRPFRIPLPVSAADGTSG